jgi:site-specific DNA-methyltransferase (adenine-specific)
MRIWGEFLVKTETLFSSSRMDWETPQEFFDKLNEEFHFTLDPCASDLNHKCEKYYTAEQDGLQQDWSGEKVFCNPPYGRNVAKWVKKCYDETHTGDCKLAVMLISARTDTKWFHDYIYNHNADEIRFIKGRLKFGGGNVNAPFPSMVVVFWGREEKY